MQKEQKNNYQNYVLVSFALMLVATAVTAIQYKIPTIMGSIMIQFSLSAHTASWLMSIFTLLGIFVALPIGFLARRVNPKSLMIAAVAVVCLAALIGIMAKEIVGLMISRALEGVALVMVVACGPLVLQRSVDPKKLGTATGIWMLGGMLGATIAGVTTPLLYEKVGFVGLWVFYALFAVISGIFLQFTVRKEPLLKSQTGTLLYNNNDAATLQKSDYKIFLKRNTWFFLIPFAVFQILILSTLSFSPTAMQQQGMDGSLSGFVSTLPMLLAIFSSIGFGAISDKLQRRKPLYLLGLIVMAVGTFVMLTAAIGPTIWIAAVVMGLLAMGTPAIVVAAYPYILGKPELLAVGMGVLLLVQSFGQFLGTFLPSLLLGPDLSRWMLCGGVLLALGLGSTLFVVFCRFR